MTQAYEETYGYDTSTVNSTRTLKKTSWNLGFAFEYQKKLGIEREDEEENGTQDTTTSRTLRTIIGVIPPFTEMLILVSQYTKENVKFNYVDEYELEFTDGTKTKATHYKEAEATLCSKCLIHTTTRMLVEETKRKAEEAKRKAEEAIKKIEEAKKAEEAEKAREADHFDRSRRVQRHRNLQECQYLKMVNDVEVEEARRKAEEAMKKIEEAKKSEEEEKVREAKHFDGSRRVLWQEDQYLKKMGFQDDLESSDAEQTHSLPFQKLLKRSDDQEVVDAVEGGMKKLGTGQKVAIGVGIAAAVGCGVGAMTMHSSRHKSPSLLPVERQENIDGDHDNYGDSMSIKNKRVKKRMVCTNEVVLCLRMTPHWDESCYSARFLQKLRVAHSYRAPPWVDDRVKGDRAFEAKNYTGAKAHYEKVTSVIETPHIYYSDRSAAYLSKSCFTNALKDANACINLNPDFAKGYYLKGTALHELRRSDESIPAFKVGLSKFPDDERLLRASKKTAEYVSANII